MTAHISFDDDDDDDLEQAPPSAQQASWAAPADVRSSRTAPRRAAAHGRGEGKAAGLGGAKTWPTASRAVTTGPATQQQQSSYWSTTHDDAQAIPRSNPAPGSNSDPSSAKPSPSVPSQGQSHAPSNACAAVAAAAAAAPTRSLFDPWHSSSTGHQRAENRLSGSTSWRHSRSLKLGEQFRGGLAGRRKQNGGWEKGAKGLRTGGQRSLVEVWAETKGGVAGRAGEKNVVDSEGVVLDEREGCMRVDEELVQPDADLSSSRPPAKQIFSGLCFYLNGSTAPLVSDHKLKHLLAIHGANHSIALGRRTVTHVILGHANGQDGCGGGLAATKIQKEITRTGGKGVKFVTAEWVLESIKADRRLPESRFLPLKFAPKNQASVFSMMKPAG